MRKKCYFWEKFTLASQGAGCGLVRASKNLCEPASFWVRARLDAIPTKNLVREKKEGEVPFTK